MDIQFFTNLENIHDYDPDYEPPKIEHHKKSKKAEEDKDFLEWEKDLFGEDQEIDKDQLI